MQDNKHELKVLMLDGADGFYRMHRYRVGDFFGPVDLGIHLSFKQNALTIGAPGMIKAINRCERALREAFPQVRWLFFEPGVEK